MSRRKKSKEKSKAKGKVAKLKKEQVVDIETKDESKGVSVLQDMPEEASLVRDRTPIADPEPTDIPQAIQSQKVRLKKFSTHLLATLINAFFLVFWAGIQYVVGIVIDAYDLSGITQIMIWTFQVLFGLASLAPVAKFIWDDIVAIFRTH